MENVGYLIPEKVKKYTQYDMIQSHTDIADFPQYRIQLLHTFLKHGAKDGADQDIHELYSVVTSLVQMGMDTHDMVDVEYDPSNLKQSRANQLKVLAGDYLSGRFYQLLAQKGQVRMIQKLSAAICEVNRLKMNLYLKIKQMKMTTEEFVQQLVHIKKQLFIPFSTCMKDELATKWFDLLDRITRCEVIVDQWKRSKNVSTFVDSWAFWHILKDGSQVDKKMVSERWIEGTKMKTVLLKYNIDSLLHQMLNDEIVGMSQYIHQLSCEPMIKELNRIGESFVVHLTTSPVLEEARGV